MAIVNFFSSSFFFMEDRICGIGIYIFVIGSIGINGFLGLI